MVKNQQIQNHIQTSILDKFSLDFEYNKTLQEVRLDVRTRTHKK